MSFSNRTGKQSEVLEAVTKTRETLKEEFNLTVLDIAIGMSYLNDEGKIVKTHEWGEYHFSLMPMEWHRESNLPLKILFEDQGLDDEAIERMRLQAQKSFEEAAISGATKIVVNIRRMNEPPLDAVELDRLQRRINQDAHARRRQDREKTILGKIRNRLGDLFGPK